MAEPRRYTLYFTFLALCPRACRAPKLLHVIFFSHSLFEALKKRRWIGVAALARPGQQNVNVFSKQKSANDDSASNCSKAYGAFLPPRAEWSNSPHLLHIQEDECRLWRLLTCRHILEVRLLCHCKWVRKRKRLNRKWSFLLWQFGFVLYGSGGTLDWFRASSGFIPSPLRDTFNHKNWTEYKREAVRCNLWPLNWSLEMGH